MDYSDSYQKMMEYDSNPLFSFDDPSLFSQGVSTADPLWSDCFFTNDSFSSPFLLNPIHSFVMEKVLHICYSLFFRQIIRERNLHFLSRRLPKE